MNWLACISSVMALSAAMPSTAANAKVRAVVVQWGEVEVVESDKVLGSEYQEHSLSHGREVTFGKYISNSDHVLAQLCRSFGFEAWLAGGAGDTLPNRILMRVSHPMQTRPDGATSTQDTLMLPVRGRVVGSSYTFDDAWEIQPGDWTFDLVLEGEVVASKTFVLTAPEPGSPGPDCPGRAVS